MKIELHGYEPRQRPFGEADVRPLIPVRAAVRKTRTQLQPVSLDARLFHAL
ncbi:MAG: hypothetical protein ACOYKQ_04770 [Polymorphobacter sp.]